MNIALSINGAPSTTSLLLTRVLTEGMFKSPALTYGLIHLPNEWIIFITGWWLTLNNPTLRQTAQQIILYKVPIVEVKTFMLLSQITINFLPTHSIISYSCIDKSMETASQKKITGILEEPTLLKDETPVYKPRKGKRKQTYFPLSFVLDTSFYPLISLSVTVPPNYNHLQYRVKQLPSIPKFNKKVIQQCSESQATHNI